MPELTVEFGELHDVRPEKQRQLRLRDCLCFNVRESGKSSNSYNDIIIDKH